MPTAPRPVIGLTGNFSADKGQQLLADAYIQAVVQSGAVPVVLPPVAVCEVGSRCQECCNELTEPANPAAAPALDNAALDALLSRLDALVFTGGGDFSARVLGEPRHPAAGPENLRRDEFELQLMKRAIEHQMPILGICRGHQLLNLALGGTLYQDLPSQFETSGKPADCVELLPHNQKAARDQASHPVDLVPGTVLLSVVSAVDKNGFTCPEAVCHPSSANAPSDENQGICLQVNSFHHQAVRDVAPGLRVAACSPDGVVEAVESTEFKPFIGVQWHPECLTQTQPVQRRLFRWLAEQAQLYRQARQCQQQAVSFDAHCDAPMFFEGRYDIVDGGGIERGKIDFDAVGDEKLEWVPSRVCVKKMQTGGLDSVVAAAYLKQLGRDDESLAAATAKARRLLSQVESQVALHPDVVGLARTPDDIVRLKSEGRKAVLLGIENAYALGKDLSLVDEFADRGVVYMTLCHNGHNDVCDSASEQDRPEYNGLSAFGREVVAAMNRRGILVDVSHASEKTFYDAVECSRVPIVATHSSVWELCRHRRNLKDDQIRLLARTGGVMGICMYDGFLAKERIPNVNDIVSHIDYVCRLVGVDYVGLGSDFDGGGGVPGCNDSAELFNITRALVARGYSQEDITKILGGNFLRVMRQAQDFAHK